MDREKLYSFFEEITQLSTDTEKDIPVKKKQSRCTVEVLYKPEREDGLLNRSEIYFLLQGYRSE